MDIKQKEILNKICSKFKLPYNIKFVQHRNLKEFRYFMIERINPNHKIQLYGKLKRNQLKDNYPNKIIKVGEILLSISLFMTYTNSFIINLQMNLLASMFLFYILYDWCIMDNLWSRFYAYWYRGRCWLRKNYISSKICLN